MQEGRVVSKSFGQSVDKPISIRMLVALVVFATVTVFSNMYITQPVLPVIGAEFKLSPAQAGLTISALVLAIAGASVFYGMLSDRVGRRPVMIASVLGLSAPTLLCALAPDFGWLVAFRVGQGLLIPGFTAITITYLQEEMPPERRNLVLGYYVSATVMGGFFGRLAGGLITDFSGNWRYSFICFAAGDLALAWLLLKFLPPSHNFVRRVANESATLVNSLESADAQPSLIRRITPAAFLVHLGNRQLLGVYVIGFSLMFSFLGLFTYLPYYLSRPPFNLSTVLISSAYVTYLVGTFSAPFSARMAPRLGKRGIIKAGYGLMLFGVLLTLVPWLPVIGLGLLFLCFGMFACQSTATALVGESVKVTNARGSAVALYQMFFYIGGSCGGFVPGLFWQIGGWSPVIGAVVAVLCLGLASAIWLCR